MNMFKNRSYKLEAILSVKTAVNRNQFCRRPYYSMKGGKRNGIGALLDHHIADIHKRSIRDGDDSLAFRLTNEVYGLSQGEFSAIRNASRVGHEAVLEVIEGIDAGFITGEMAAVPQFVTNKGSKKTPRPYGIERSRPVEF